MTPRRLLDPADGPRRSGPKPTTEALMRAWREHMRAAGYETRIKPRPLIDWRKPF